VSLTAGVAPRRHWIVPLAIFGLALGLRLLPALALDSVTLYSDSGEYDRIARHILRFGDYSPTAYRPPLYPYFLAAVMVLAEASNRAVLLAQALLGALTALLTYGIGLRASRTVAAWAGAAVATYPTLVIYTALLMSENLYVPLLLGVVLALQQIERRGGIAWSAVAGALGALAALTRSAALMLAPAGALLMGPRGLKPRLARALIAAAMTVVLIAPWTYRNIRFFGSFIPIDTNAGFNLMVGNNPRATGQLRLDILRDLAREHLEGKSELERHGAGVRVARDFVLGHPLQFLGLIPRKLGYLFGLEGRELLWAYSHTYFGAARPWVLRLCLIGVLAGFPLLFLSALLGFTLRPDRVIGLVVLYTAAVHAVSFGESRFHLPLVPLLAVLGASGWLRIAREGWPAWRGVPGARRGAALLIGVAAAAHWILELAGYWPRLQTLLAAGGHRAAFPY